MAAISALSKGSSKSSLKVWPYSATAPTTSCLNHQRIKWAVGDGERSREDGKPNKRKRFTF